MQMISSERNLVYLFISSLQLFDKPKQKTQIIKKMSNAMVELKLVFTSHGDLASIQRSYKNKSVITLSINETLFNTLPIDCRVFCIMHELAHLMLGHLDKNNIHRSIIKEASHYFAQLFILCTVVSYIQSGFILIHYWMIYMIILNYMLQYVIYYYIRRDELDADLFAYYAMSTTSSSSSSSSSSSTTKGRTSNQEMPNIEPLFELLNFFYKQRHPFQLSEHPPPLERLKRLQSVQYC